MRGLSGNGMQIVPSTLDPDRGCKVACQDEYLQHRFYLVNGDQGYFPFGTKCSRDSVNDNRYCVNGKCLQFDHRNIPLVESHISLALYRSRRSSQLDDLADEDSRNIGRSKRDFLFYEPVNITERISKELLQNLINNLVLVMSPVQGNFHIFSNKYELISFYDKKVCWHDMFLFAEEHLSEQQIDLTNPIHISLDDFHNLSNKLS